ncbi:MAG: serine hydroxymethyltransferase, partial [Alphaproteobacteria bacterium]
MYSQHISRVESLVVEQEEWRRLCINLIASEQVLSRRARAVMGSDFCHRYAEGHPGERYYQGTEKIDTIESDVKRYLKALFGCLHTEVRPISGTNANEAVFSRYIKPGDIVMVNSTPAGGHISHQRAGSVGKFTRNILTFPRTKDGYHIDVGRAKSLIRATRPKLIVLGKSLFLFPEPIEELFDVCGKVGARVVYDGAHVLGLIAGGQFQNPFAEGAHIVCGSTHKTFPGPQRGMILSNLDWEEWRSIDKVAFPGSSSNHHLDTLPPLLVTTFEMLAFAKEYAAQTVKNAKVLGAALDENGFDVQAKEFGYTESHQLAVDVSGYGGGSAVSSQLKENN